MIIDKLIELRENKSKEEFIDIILAAVDDVRVNGMKVKEDEKVDKFIEILDISAKVVTLSYKDA